MKKPFKHKAEALLVTLIAVLLAIPTLALAAWQDGVYQDIGQGYSGELVITVTVRQGTIADIQAQGRQENTDDFLQTALDGLTPLIIQNNSADGVEAVSGATLSSQAILGAVEGILKQASATLPAQGETAGMAGGPDASTAPGPSGAPAPAPTVDPSTAQFFTGLGSAANFRIGPGKDVQDIPVYSFNVTMASCVFDKEGRILDVQVDIYEVATPNYDGASMPHFSGWPARQGYNITDPATGQVTGVSVNTEESITQEVTAWATKRERGASYGMNPANEWYQQMDAYERWMVGQTVEELRDWFARYTSPRNGRPIKVGSDNAEDQKLLKEMNEAQKAQLADVISMATMSLSDPHGLILEALEKAWQNRTPVTGVDLK